MHDIITFGNNKLHKNWANFSLPTELTCPKQTEYCKQYCYAKKAEAQYYKTVPQFKKANYILSQSDSFIDLMINKINNKKEKIKVFRIHVSGDFYSQEYFNKWCEIARNFSIIPFIAFTRNNDLNLQLKPQNLILKYSIEMFEGIDKKKLNIVFKENKGFDGISLVIKKEENAENEILKQNFYLCKYKQDKCGYNCTKCTTKSNILFIKH